MMTPMRAVPITEGEILESIVAANGPALSPEAARSFLRLKFPAKDATRVRHLLRKNNSGRATAHERIALEKYLRVGQFLDILHARARWCWRKGSEPASPCPCAAN